MPYRVIQVQLDANVGPYSAGLTAAATETRTFAEQAAAAGHVAEQAFAEAARGTGVYTESVTAAAEATRIQAQAAVAAGVQQVESLQVLKSEYASTAAAAAEGSAEQLIALRLQADATRQLAGAQGLKMAENDANALSQAMTNMGRTGSVQTNVLSGALKSVRAEFAALPVAGQAATALGIGIAIMAVEGVKHFQELTGEVRAFQRVSGASAEDSSRLIYSMHQLGIEPEAAAKALGIFSRNLVDHADKVQAAGVETAHLKNGQIDLIGTLYNLADSYQKAGAGAEGNALAAGLLGRGYQTLLPLLQRGRDGLKEFFDEAERHGVVFSQKDVDSARELTLATRNLSGAWQGLEIAIGKQAVPALAQAVSGLANLIDKAHELGGSLGEAKVGTGNLKLSITDLAESALKYATPLGHIYDGLTASGDKNAKVTKDQLVAFQEAKSILGTYGDTVDDTVTTTDDLSQSQQQLVSQVKQHQKAMEDSAASIGMSSDALAANLGYQGVVGVDAFKAEEAAAQAFTAAVTQAGQAASGAFAKDFSSTQAFSASALESAAKSSDKSTTSMVKDDSRLADATQHVADLQAQYAEQASTARDAYAQKVEQADQTMSDAEQRYADTVASENQRVVDAIQGVQDAKDRLVADDATSAQSVADAQQRIADLAERNSASTPAQSAAISKAQEMRRAQEDLAKAQARSGEQHAKDEEAIVKAQEAADKARVDQARNVGKAEEGVTKAREAQNRLAAEGNTIGQQTLQQSTEMRKAVEAVTKAQEGLGSAMGGAGAVQRSAIKLTTDDVRAFYEQSNRDANTFSTNVKTAIQKGYDPGLISELLKEGPKEAAPFLEFLVSNNDKNLEEMINTGERRLRQQALHMADMAKATQVAVQTTSAQTRTDYDLEMKALEILAANGGTLTAGALAKQLGVGVEVVQRIANEYGGAIASGINPLLEGIGVNSIAYVPGKPVTYDPGSYSFRAQGGIEDHQPQIAKGGPVRVWAEPETEWEAYIPGAADRRPRAVEITREVVDRFGYDMVPKKQAGAGMFGHEMRYFAGGGFVLPGDVPQPPDYTGHGTMLGYSADKVDHHLYDAVVAYVKAHPPTLSGAGGRTGAGYGWEAIAHFYDMMGLSYQVTSTVRPGDPGRHGIGDAVDAVGDMAGMARALMTVLPAVYEGIWNPSGGAGLSVKAGQVVDPSFWGAATWAQHGGGNEHLHAASFIGPSEGPGFPTGGPGDSGAAGGGDARAIGQRMAAARGWVGDEWTSLDQIWTHESGWDASATSVNPSSGAYGIPQANPSGGQGHPYALDDIPGQIQWGLDYIATRYGDPNAAWAFWQGHNWYGQGGIHGGPEGLTVHATPWDRGGIAEPGANLIWNGTGAREQLSNTTSSSAVTVTFGDIIAAPGTTTEQAESIYQQVRQKLIAGGEDAPGGTVLTRR